MNAMVEGFGLEEAAAISAEANKLYANAEALDKEYKRLDEAYEDFYDDYDYDDEIIEFIVGSGTNDLPDYIGDYYAKK
jgi:hypothetical protein